MKKNNSLLPALWSAAGLSLLIGLLLSIHTVGSIGRTTEIWQKKSGDLQELLALRKVAAERQNILKHYARFPAAPVPLETLARNAGPGLNPALRSTETHPTVPGWTARRINIGLNDMSGDDLGRFLEAASTATPPWALMACTLSASPTPGRLAKAELILETVERN